MKDNPTITNGKTTITLIPPKPIFIIAFPKSKFLTNSQFEDAANHTIKMMPDYHIICYTADLEYPEFQAFYEKDFNEIKFEELKKLVSDKLK